MARNYLFVGNYKRSGNKLTHTDTPNLQILIAERQKVTSKKSKYFILDKSTPSGKYISSLYELGNNQFYFDYQGLKYKLELGKDTAVINLTS